MDYPAYPRARPVRLRRADGRPVCPAVRGAGLPRRPPLAGVQPQVGGGTQGAGARSGHRRQHDEAHHRPVRRGRVEQSHVRLHQQFLRVPLRCAGWPHTDPPCAHAVVGRDPETQVRDVLRVQVHLALGLLVESGQSRHPAWHGYIYPPALDTPAAA